MMDVNWDMLEKLFFVFLLSVLGLMLMTIQPVT